MEVTLIRHAEVERGDDGTVPNDPELSARGRDQVKALATSAARWPAPTAVLVSPTIRTRRTAEPLCSAWGVEPTDAPWLEEIRVGAETMAEFHDRVTTGLSRELVERGAAPQSDATPPRSWALDPDGAAARIVLVGHGAANAVALEYLLGMPTVDWAWYRFQLSNTGITRLKAFELESGWVFGMLKHNTLSHLSPQMRSV